MQIARKVIILISGDDVECWGSLTEACKNHPEFSYSTLKAKKFPFTYKGVTFKKVFYREKNF